MTASLPILLGRRDGGSGKPAGGGAPQVAPPDMKPYTRGGAGVGGAPCGRPGRTSLGKVSDMPNDALPHLRVDRPRAEIAVLTLDNPDQRNTMSEQMTASWVTAIDRLAGDREVRVVVVTGEGSAF